MNIPLITKYRPTTFDEMVGHTAIKTALCRAVGDDSAPHSFLMTGPAGTGKTSTARILSDMLGCELVEIDAASNSGVDAMRELVELGNHMGLSGAGKRMIVIDECFAPKTQVKCIDGSKSIKDICPGDTVLGAKGFAKVRKVFKNKIPLTRVLQLRLAGSPTIICSEDHAFLTENGWLKAKDLHGQSIYREGAQIQHNLLSLWDMLYEQRPCPLAEMRPLQNSNHSNKKVPRVQKAIFEHCSALFSNMRQFSGWAQTKNSLLGRNENKDRRGFKGVGAIKSRTGSGKEALSQDADLQSNGEFRNSFKNGGNKKNKWNFNSGKALARRQWQGAIEAAIVFVKSFGRSNGVCHHDYASITLGIQMSECLQSRFSFSDFETRDRSRWGYPQFEGGETARSQKRYGSRFARVESITRIQPGSDESTGAGLGVYQIGDEYFTDLYDLEIDGHPSYSAEGLLVHNCHTLSKNGWDVLLKILEEPPPWLYFSLCTTNVPKVPPAIVSRCYHIALRPLAPQEIEELLLLIIDVEEWQVAGDVLTAVIQAAGGSPRQAISLLQAVRDAPNKEEVGRIIALFELSEPIIALCQYLVSASQYDWPKIRAFLEAVPDGEWDNSTVLIGRYIAGAMMKAKKREDAERLWKMIDAITFPVETFDRKVAFYAALGKIIF